MLLQLFYKNFITFYIYSKFTIAKSQWLMYSHPNWTYGWSNLTLTNVVIMLVASGNASWGRGWYVVGRSMSFGLASSLPNQVLVKEKENKESRTERLPTWNSLLWMRPRYVLLQAVLSLSILLGSNSSVLCLHWIFYFIFYLIIILT